jgi:hypothetical protein
MLICAIIFTLVTAPEQTPRSSKQQPANESQQAGQAETKAIESIAADINAINERQTKAETQRAQQEPETTFDRGFGPATWSSWALFIAAVVASAMTSPAETQPAAGAPRL